VYLPRSDSSILENVVTTVCDGDSYHYGFNGKLKDNEWAGVGNHYDYAARRYDSRIARFISVDPLKQKFPWWTPYAFAGNTPIQAIDLEGLEILNVNSSMYKMKYAGSALITTTTKSELRDLNIIHINSQNVPSNYSIENAFNVGTHGENDYNAKPYSGARIRQTYGSSDDLGDPDSREQKGVDIVTQKRPRIVGGTRIIVKERSGPVSGNGAYSAVTAFVDAFKWGSNVFSGNKELIADFDEDRLRGGFYESTNLVDKTLSSPRLGPVLNYAQKMNSIGNFRADLINYVTDGTAPNSYKEGMSNGQKAAYDKSVRSLGNWILKTNNKKTPEK
jgi:RHS repeat-associated protein